MIGIEHLNPIGGDIDVNQRRVRLEDHKDSKCRFISNVFIYCAQYYPATKEFAGEFIRYVCQDHYQTVTEAVRHLYQSMEREIIIGPSSSHLPASEIPTIAKQNSSMELSNPYSDAEDKEWLQTYQQLKLEKMIPRERVNELKWYNCSKLLSMKAVQQSNLSYRHFRNQLEIDGQSWLESTPFPGLVVLLQYLLEILVNQIKLPKTEHKKMLLVWTRLSFLHNKHLKSPVKKLCSRVLTNYKQIMTQAIDTYNFDEYIELLLEYSFALLFYYKYSQCESIIRHCASLLKMKMEFTGKLGRRTKYQVFDTPLLVMDLVRQQEKVKVENIHDKNEDEQEKDDVVLLDAKKLVAKIKEESGPLQETGLTAAAFQQESILLETPKFVEQVVNKNEIKEVNEHHLLVALATLFFEWKSTPHDQMLFQNITAAINTLLKYTFPTSFSYSFAILLLRSLNQFPRLKNTERALDQLQKLRVSFNSKVNKNMTNLYATPYDTHLEFILILAEKYMDIGLSMTAVDLYQQVGLYEECIDGLIMKNYKEKALELAIKLIDEKGKNPRLLCMLGDIKKGSQVEYYQQAWEMSNHTSARAQRSLGWYYFNKKQYQKAVECFTKATQASYYHPGTWYTLGCACMQLKQFQKALKAFSECISIDETQGEAWGNIASCYMFNKKWNEAYSTLIQAVRYSQGNWKLWANLLSVSLTLKKFYKYLECIEKLVKLGHQQLLNEQVLSKIIQMMKYQNQTLQRKRALHTFKNRIDRLYIYMIEQIGQNELVWRSCTNYQIELLEYFNVLEVHYHNLHIEHKLDQNDFVPGYETIQSVALNSKICEKETKMRIVECKQNQLNMTMKVGWDQNKLQSTRVKAILEEYINIYKQYSSRQDKQDFKLFVSGVASKISNCLQQPYVVTLSWL